MEFSFADFQTCPDLGNGRFAKGENLDESSKGKKHKTLPFHGIFLFRVFIFCL